MAYYKCKCGHTFHHESDNYCRRCKGIAEIDEAKEQENREVQGTLLGGFAGVAAAAFISAGTMFTLPGLVVGGVVGLGAYKGVKKLSTK